MSSIQYCPITVCMCCMQTGYFGVHLESLPSRAERLRFAAFLRHGHLVADIYDGDSHILLGVAKVPLAVSFPVV